MQHILGSDRFPANARFGEGHVFSDIRIEMVADHQHVEMFIDGVDGIRQRRVGGGGQNIRMCAGGDNIRRMAAACAFGMEGMNGAIANRRQRILNKPGLIERIAMQRHRMSISSATVSAQSIAAGVAPQSSWIFRPMAPALICSRRPSGFEPLPLPSKPMLTGNVSAACSMRAMYHGPGVQVVALVPAAGPVPPPIIVVTPETSASCACCGQIQ